MELKVQLPFEQLLTVVKTLTPAEKERLRQELDEKTTAQDDQDAFIKLLLNGPTYTSEEIAVIENNRKSIAQWRTKD